jgi:site-specific recombinase XerC
MATEVGEALARVGQRDAFTGPDDLVFVGLAGGHLDASALLRRYRVALRSAGLRPLRFHDLRHTFGTRVIAEADIRVQEWMGTPTCRPRCAICTTRRGTTTLRSSVARSQPIAFRPALGERPAD